MAEPYKLSCAAEEMYEHLAKGRERVIETARDLAEITIPSVFPPEGYEPGDNIASTNQSVNALCVNTLASKLMLRALPPNLPMMRFEPIAHKLRADIEADPALWTRVQIGLAELELEHRSRLAATNLRTSYVGLMKLLLIAGNGLWEHIDLDAPAYHPMTKYVVKRNKRGEVLLTILERNVEVEDLDPSAKVLIQNLAPEAFEGKRDYEVTVDIYAVCKRVGRKGSFKWEYWEEFRGEVLPDTEVTVDYDIPPLYPMWLIPVMGKNWGRSYCEEYRGDLYKVENLEAALNDGASMSSLVWNFLKPGARTSLRQLKKAENLSLMVGSADDITTFRLDKGQDFQFVLSNAEKAIQRLGRVFLLMSSVQRDAERVTAEEWTRLAAEIDEAMGGLYSEIAQGAQRHVIRRAIALHNAEDDELPELPKGIFRVSVVTGVEAMGRSLELQALVRGLQTVVALFGPEAVRRINIGDVMQRVFTAESVRQQQTILVSEEAVQQAAQAEMQRQMTSEVVSQGAGPVAGALAKQMTLQDPGAAPPAEA